MTSPNASAQNLQNEIKVERQKVKQEEQDLIHAVNEDNGRGEGDVDNGDAHYCGDACVRDIDGECDDGVDKDVGGDDYGDGE